MTRLDTTQDIKIAKTEQFLKNFKEQVEINHNEVISQLKFINREMINLKIEKKEQNGKVFFNQEKIRRLERVVYGTVSLVLVAFVGGLVSLVIK